MESKKLSASAKHKEAGGTSTVKIDIRPEHLLISEEIPFKIEADVLIVEDEILYAALLEKYLAELPSLFAKIGMPLPDVSNGERSINIKKIDNPWSLLQADLSQVKLVISDIMLPQMTGVDLIKHIQKTNPNIAVVPISGMATEPQKRQLEELLPEGVKLVEKPLRREQLLHMIEKSLLYSLHNKGHSQAPELNMASDEPLWNSVNSNNAPQVVVQRRIKRKSA